MVDIFISVIRSEHMKIRKRDIEIILQKIPPHPAPQINFEQYPTPADIAADILFSAFLGDDIAEKTVLDLGTGTGIFAIGAKLLGAEDVIGVDIDGTGLAIAEGYAKNLSLDIKFIEKDINKFDITELSNKHIDTIFQNPPFGAQKGSRGADRTFLEKALSWGKVIYSLHLTKTTEFIELLLNKLGGELVLKKNYRFPICHTYFFHTKEKVEFDITLFKIITKFR